MSPSRRLVAGLASVALLVTACGGAGTSAGQGATTSPPTSPLSTSEVSVTTTPAPTSAPAQAAPSSAPPATVDERLRFTARTVDGKDFDGTSLAGKPAVLWFWTPWCPKCNAEASGVAEVARNNAGKVTFVGVAAQDQVPRMQQFAQRHGVDFTHLADTDLAVWRRFGVTYQPAYAFVAANGDIQVETTQLSRDALAARVAGLA